MTNRITLVGKLLDAPKVRSFESRSGTIETVSLWIETTDGGRFDRFTIDIACPKASAAAKAMQAGVLVEINGKLRHDRWKDKHSNRWTGKVYVAVDPGEGKVRSQGMAPEAQRPQTQREAALAA